MKLMGRIEDDASLPTALQTVSVKADDKDTSEEHWTPETRPATLLINALRQILKILAATELTPRLKSRRKRDRQPPRHAQK